MFEVDHEAQVKETEFRGVYIVYSKADAKVIARGFMKNIHAFVKTVVPSLLCYDLNVTETRDVIKVVACVLEGVPRLFARLRGSSRALTNLLIEVGAEVVENPKGNDKVVAVEGVNNLVLISLGTFKSCGPGCLVLFPEEAVLRRCV